MKKSILLAKAFCLGVVILAASTLPSLAQSNWKLQFVMRGEPSGKVMSRPFSLFVDQEKERYYVADTGNNRLLSYDRNGEFLNAFNANGKLLVPVDMGREKDGRLLVVEKGNASLTRIDLKGKGIQLQALKDGQRNIIPQRLEQAGDLFYILDKGSGEILAFSAELKIKQRFGCPECSNGFIDFKLQNQKVWALALSEKTVYRFAMGGELETKIPLAPDAVEFPCSLAPGPDGRLYILDRHRGAVVVFEQSGRMSYRFLSRGEGREQLYYPVELLFDPWGRLCVVEEGNGRVDVFSR